MSVLLSDSLSRSSSAHYLEELCRKLYLCSSEQKCSIFKTPLSESPSTWGQSSFSEQSLRQSAQTLFPNMLSLLLDYLEFSF